MDSGEDYDPFEEEYYTEDEPYYNEDEIVNRSRADYMEAFRSYNESKNVGLPPIEEVVVHKRPKWQVGDTVTVRVGNWEKEIELNRYPNSFLKDVYYDVMEEKGDDVIELEESSMSLLPQQWEKYHTLLEWMKRGEYIFYMGPNDEEAQKMRDENTLPVIHYADVAFAIATLGMKNDRWMLYVILDDRTPASERYHIDLARGRMIEEAARVDMMKEYKKWPKNMIRARKSMRDEVEAIHEGEVKEAMLSTIDSTLIGMAQNSYLAMIGDGTSASVPRLHRVTTKAHNRIAGIGIEGSVALEGLNWAYLIPSDVLVLCKQIGINPYNDEEVMNFVTSPEWFSIRHYRLSIDAYGFAIPLAYWMGMEAIPDYADPISFGLQGLTSTGKYEGTASQFAAINEVIIFAPSSFASGKMTVVHSLYLPATVKYMRKYLGLLALVKIYRVMKHYYDNTGDSKTKQFLDAARSIVIPVLNKTYTKDEVWNIAKNDKNGLLLTALPSDRDNRDFAKSIGLAWKK